MLRQPVVQLNPGAMGHTQIGDDHLVSLGRGMPELAQCNATVLRLVRVPSSAAEIASQSSPNRRLIVDHQHAPL